MTDLIIASGDNMIIYAPDGSEFLNTADRTACILGTQTYTGITMTWPAVSGEQLNGRFGSGGSLEFRWTQPAAELTYTTTIGAFSSPVTPNFLLATIKGTRTAGGNIFGFITTREMLPSGLWVPVNGSVWLEHARSSNPGDNSFMNRHFSIGISGSNFVFNRKQSGSGWDDTSDWGSLPSGALGTSETTWSFDVKITWGVFDL